MDAAAADELAAAKRSLSRRAFPCPALEYTTLSLPDARTFASVTALTPPHDGELRLRVCSQTPQPRYYEMTLHNLTQHVRTAVIVEGADGQPRELARLSYNTLLRACTWTPTETSAHASPLVLRSTQRPENSAELQVDVLCGETTIAQPSRSSAGIW